MNDDELIQRLRRTLRAEADAIDLERGTGRVSPLAARSRLARYGPRAVAGLAAAAVVAGAVLVAVHLSGPGGGSTSIAVQSPDTTAPATATTRPADTVAPQATTSAPPSTVPATTTPTTVTTLPAVAPIGTDFVPASVTFVTADEGWVLGVQHCQDHRNLGCMALTRTVDGGRTWSAVHAPDLVVPVPTTGAAGSALQVRFATSSDGWIWGTVNGATWLWATFDGGTTWTPQALPGVTASSTIQSLETADGLVHLVALTPGGTYVVDTSPVGPTGWTQSSVAVPVGAGPVPSATITLQQSGGWIIENDRVVTAGARLQHGGWKRWTPPCAGLNGPGALAASSSSDVAAVCDEGVWGPAPTSGGQLFVSGDGGTQFHAVGAAPSGMAAIASPTASTVVGAPTGTGTIDATFDGGGRWSTVYNAPGETITQVGFENADQGVAVSGADGSPAGQLLMTRDGGHHWVAVNLAT